MARNGGNVKNEHPPGTMMFQNAIAEQNSEKEKTGSKKFTEESGKKR